MVFVTTAQATLRLRTGGYIQVNFRLRPHRRSSWPLYVLQVSEIGVQLVAFLFVTRGLTTPPQPDLQCKRRPPDRSGGHLSSRGLARVSPRPNREVTDNITF